MEPVEIKAEQQADARNLGVLRDAIDEGEALRYPHVELVRWSDPLEPDLMSHGLWFTGEPERVTIPRDLLFRFADAYEGILTHAGGEGFQLWNRLLLAFAQRFGPVSQSIRPGQGGVLEPLEQLREHSASAYHFRTFLEILELPEAQLFQESARFAGKRFSPFCHWTPSAQGHGLGRILVSRNISSAHPRRGALARQVYELGPELVPNCPTKIREAISCRAQDLLRHYIDREVSLKVGADWAPRPTGRSILGLAWLYISERPLGTEVELRSCPHCGGSFLVGGKFRKRSARSCSDSCKNMASRARAKSSNVIVQAGIRG